MLPEHAKVPENQREAPINSPQKFTKTDMLLNYLKGSAFIFFHMHCLAIQLAWCSYDEILEVRLI